MNTNNLTGKNYGCVTIGTIVSYILDEKGLTSRYSEFAEGIATKIIRGFQNFNLYHLDNRKVVYLPISEMNTATLPLDYVNYVKIGINLHGRVWTLTANPSIVLNRVPECGQDVRQVVNGSAGTEGYGYYFPDHFRNGRFVGGLYGVGGGWNKGYFRIDNERGEIVLDGILPQRELILEYISNGISIGQQTIIPQQAVEPLINWVMYLETRADKTAPAWRVREAKDTYEQSVEQMRLFENSLSASEFADIIWEASRQSPKR